MDYRAALLEETRRFGEVVGGADPQTPIPTCPGWTMTQLFRHVGRGHRWAAQMVAEHRREPLDPREVRDGKPPADPAAALRWLEGGAQSVLDAVDGVGVDSRAWTFLGSRSAGWWIGRRLHEATVHRADAQLALGAEVDLSAALAADGVTEWIDVVTSAADRRAPPLARGTTLHLHATDDGLGSTGEWSITNDDDGLTWTHDHQRGEAAVRGTAVGLLLAITRRRTAAELGLQVLGDPAAWDGWLERTPF